MEIQCLYMERNINFEKILENEIEIVKKSDKKPKLLLHTCCGPCFTIPFEILNEYFDITLIFNNSNIFPESEFYRRKDELKKYVSSRCPYVNIIELPYDNITYVKDLEPYRDQPEGHERCRVCFKKRLSQGFDYAESNGFDYFGTVMTISRYKNAQDINKIGLELEKSHTKTKWLCADFKKNNGYEKSLVLIKESNMYFQEYCGCQFSYEKYMKKVKN